jgi:hypothetical protein
MSPWKMNRWVQIPFHAYSVLLVRQLQLVDDTSAPIHRNETQRLLVHRRLELVGTAAREPRFAEVHPLEGVERALGRARIRFEPLFQEARDRRLTRTDRAVQKDDAAFRTIALRRGLEHVHEPHQRNVETEDRVFAVVDFVAEEVVANELLLVVDVLFRPVRDDHVIDALECVPRGLWPFSNDGEVFLERPLPGEVAVPLVVLKRGDPRNHGAVFRLAVALRWFRTTLVHALRFPGTSYSRVISNHSAMRPRAPRKRIDPCRSPAFLALRGFSELRMHTSVERVQH